jgi:ABC-2 type transport system ATP-binding protein
MTAIELDSVTKRFGKQTAVDRLDWTVPEGSLYGFIGPNGSGKTTTLRMILNIFPPDDGTVSVFGSADRTAARDRMGYLPEERGLYKKVTVRRLLNYYAQLKGLSAPEARARTVRWLDRLGLSDAIDKKVEALSKGMSQKVQFIAAVIAEPKLLILDEPFSGLDPVNAEVIRESILELKRAGATIIFSTHDMSVAERLCDRIFMIYRGKKVLDGTLEEIQTRYGRQTIRLMTSRGLDALSGISGVDELVDHGNIQELRYSGDPGQLLRSLLDRAEVRHFEIAKPSLHQIFVRIAAPDRADIADGLAGRE